eukprot:4989878-Amphidinium_carterae.1
MVAIRIPLRYPPCGWWLHSLVLASQGVSVELILLRCATRVQAMSRCACCTIWLRWTALAAEKWMPLHLHQDRALCSFKSKASNDFARARLFSASVGRMLRRWMPSQASYPRRCGVHMQAPLAS